MIETPPNTGLSSAFPEGRKISTELSGSKCHDWQDQQAEPTEDCDGEKSQDSGGTTDESTLSKCWRTFRLFVAGRIPTL